MRFAKYHGCGNSFIILTEKGVLDNGFAPETYGDLAVAICSEPYGIGADGLIIVRTEPQLEMVFYNSDGSRAPMCGNGIRCFAKYCIDEKIRTEDVFKVKTAAGQMVVNIKKREPFLVEIDMGRPLFDPAKCAIDTEAAGRSASEPFMNVMLEIDNGKFVNVSSIFMGTIHTVIWTDDLDSIDKESLGKYVSNAPVYTEKTNVNMVQLIDSKTLKMQTYERGAGMTLACGTGACASVVIGVLEGKCDKEVDVQLPLGTLHIRQDASGEMFMRGPAVKIADGNFEGGKK